VSHRCHRSSFARENRQSRDSLRNGSCRRYLVTQAGRGEDRLSTHHRCSEGASQGRLEAAGLLSLAVSPRRSVPVAAMSILRLPHCEHSPSRYSGTVVSAPYRSAIWAESGSASWPHALPDDQPHASRSGSPKRHRRGPDTVSFNRVGSGAAGSISRVRQCCPGLAPTRRGRRSGQPNGAAVHPRPGRPKQTIRDLDK
jgi:hypothetical protein